MRWTRWPRSAFDAPTNEADADAKSCGPGIPVLMPSVKALTRLARRGQDSRSPGRARISVKTAAQGMPDDPAAPVVTAACFS
jgi:hypothetical protein